MSLASALRNRSALWHDVLDSFGYRFAEPRRRTGNLAELSVRAVRPIDYIGPAAVIDVFEALVAGDDPDSLGVKDDGCHLHAASWHAQIAPTGDIGADRVDLHRAKPRPLAIHRHPFGQPNEVRLPAASLFVPARWVEHVEEVIYEHFHFDS